MILKTRLNNILGKLANREDAKTIRPKIKDEELLLAIRSAINPFVISFSGLNSNSNATCSATWDEIVAAYNADRKIVATYNIITTVGDVVVSSTALALNTRLLLEFDGGAHLTGVDAFGYTVGDDNETFLKSMFYKCSISQSGVSVAASYALIPDGK